MMMIVDHDHPPPCSQIDQSEDNVGLPLLIVHNCPDFNAHKLNVLGLMFTNLMLSV